MAIEIEMYAERRSNSGWVLAEPKVPNPWRRPEYRDLVDEHDSWLEPAEVPRKVVELGHSGVWTVLWGGSRHPYEHVPIVKPRGLPDDLSVDLAEYAPAEVDPFPSGVGWYGLSELLDHDWDQVDRYRRYTSVRRRRLEAPDLRWKTPWPWRRWQVATHRELVGRLFFDALDRLRAIDDPSRIRVVYWVGD